MFAHEPLQRWEKGVKMAGPLTNTKRGGALYTRPFPVEAQIDEAMLYGVPGVSWLTSVRPWSVGGTTTWIRTVYGKLWLPVSPRVGDFLRRGKGVAQACDGS